MLAMYSASLNEALNALSLTRRFSPIRFRYVRQRLPLFLVVSSIAVFISISPSRFDRSYFPQIAESRRTEQRLLPFSPSRLQVLPDLFFGD